MRRRPILEALRRARGGVAAVSESTGFARSTLYDFASRRWSRQPYATSRAIAQALVKLWPEDAGERPKVADLTEQLLAWHTSLPAARRGA